MTEKNIVTPETPGVSIPSQPEQSQPQSEQPEIQLNVDPNTHMALAVQDFDRKIAEAKAAVADLEKQRANYIYETNVKLLITKAQQNSEGQQG